LSARAIDDRWQYARKDGTPYLGESYPLKREYTCVAFAPRTLLRNTHASSFTLVKSAQRVGDAMREVRAEERVVTTI
jgi:hypothetical protein